MLVWVCRSPACSVSKSLHFHNLLQFYEVLLEFTGERRVSVRWVDAPTQLVFAQWLIPKPQKEITQRKVGRATRPRILKLNC